MRNLRNGTVSGPAMRAALFLCLVCFSMPRSAAAQCVLSGEVAIDDVTPRGTTLRLDLTEEARVTIEGPRAHVEGLRPIAFEGSARSRDVHLFLSTQQTVGGAIAIGAATPVRVNRVAGARASSFVDAGPVRIGVSVPCDGLALAAPTVPDEASEERSLDRVLLVRGRSLQVFSGATGQRGVRLNLRAGAAVSEWPWLESRGVVGSRIHVTASLADGVTIDGWVERSTVYRPDVLEGHSCCGSGTIGGCGHAYAGQTYRGAARITAGAVLLDEDGRAWGRVVSDLDVSVVVATFRSTTTQGSTTEGTTTESATTQQTTTTTHVVWIESLPGLLSDRCEGLGVQVDRASIVLPTDTR